MILYTESGMDGLPPRVRQQTGRHINVEDLILQHELEICKERDWDLFLCPCRHCYGGYQYTIRTIQLHLQNYGRDPFLLHSIVGDDLEGGFPLQGIWIDNMREYFPDTNIFDDTDMGSEYQENLDPYYNIQQQLFDTFDLNDCLKEETSYIFKDDVEEDEADNNIEQDIESLDDLYRKGVYASTNMSIISACIVLINMAVIHNVSNA